MSLQLPDEVKVEEKVTHYNLSKSQAIDILRKQIVTAWDGHGPFATWLVEMMKPHTTVDLGVDYGYSTLCFLLGGSGEVVGIDSFEGDPHTGMRDTFQQFLNNHEFARNVYPSINTHIRLIRGYFHEQSQKWCREAGKPIDILHIDGLHEYASVKQDFQDWVPLTNFDAIVLMHDTLSFPHTVGKFFQEIPYPKFNFLHTHGLGVVCRDKNKLQRLYDELKGQFGPVSELMNT